MKGAIEPPDLCCLGEHDDVGTFPNVDLCTRESGRLPEPRTPPPRREGRLQIGWNLPIGPGMEVLGEGHAVEPHALGHPDHPSHRARVEGEVLGHFGVRVRINPLQSRRLLGMPSTSIHIRPHHRTSRPRRLFPGFLCIGRNIPQYGAATSLRHSKSCVTGDERVLLGGQLGIAGRPEEPAARPTGLQRSSDREQRTGHRRPAAPRRGR